ncbi:MAG: hypothetical protein ACYC2H_07395 [Thermoplasmatota archaeon]
MGTVVSMANGLPIPLALLLGSLAAAVVAAGTYFVQQDRLRTDRAFQAICDGQGWAMSDQGLLAAAFLVDSLPYRRGHSLVAKRVLAGARDGVALRVVDARYERGSGKHKSYHNASTVALEMPFPLDLTIEPETFGHKVADALGGEDIDVESDEFSRRFWVKSPDRRTAYAVLHPGAIEFLLKVGSRMTWHWYGGWLVMTWKGRLAPQEVLPAVATAFEFRGRLPRHLLPAGSPRPSAPARRS